MGGEEVVVRAQCGTSTTTLSASLNPLPDSCCSYIALLALLCSCCLVSVTLLLTLLNKVPLFFALKVVLISTGTVSTGV